ncbi:MAG: SurA N-terminal domain-containing protein [Deferrisomatales bacterium]
MRRVLLVLLGLLCAGSAQAVIVDGVAAVVNGTVLTRSEVEEALALDRRTGRAAGEETLEKALDHLIERALVAQEAEHLGIRVTEEEVDSAVGEIQRRNGMSPESFRAALTAQGMDYEKYLEEVRYEILRMKVASRVLRARLRVSDDALREYYLRNVSRLRKPGAVRLCHIQIPGEQAEETAEAVRRRILAGEDPEELARRVSTGPTADEGGDMGLVPLSELSEQVRQAVADLPEGGVSPVVRMGGACHLFAILDRTEGEIPSFESVRDEIRDLYFRDKEEELYRAWMGSLKEKARIERKM